MIYAIDLIPVCMVDLVRKFHPIQDSNVDARVQDIMVHAVKNLVQQPTIYVTVDRFPTSVLLSDIENLAFRTHTPPPFPYVEIYESEIFLR